MMDDAVRGTVMLEVLIATQDSIRFETLLDLIDSLPNLPGEVCADGYREDRAYVVPWRGGLYIEDGHHRLSALMIAGYQHHTVYLVDVMREA